METKMKIRKIATGIAATLGLIIAGTFLLPSSVTVERKKVIAANDAAVFALISSNEGFQTFNPYKDTDPNLAITLSGPANGIGSGFAFKGADGEGTQTITALEPNRSVTMQIDLGAMGKPIQSFALAPVEGGTEVTWRVTSDFGYNPIGRVFGMFMDGMLGPIYERGLGNLDKVAKS
jgi:Polyketide cyclase / dehydrase and lipid transport